MKLSLQEIVSTDYLNVILMMPSPYDYIYSKGLVSQMSLKLTFSIHIITSKHIMCTY